MQRETRLAYIEWDSYGKVCRIVRAHQPGDDPSENALDRVANALRTPLSFDDFDVNWCERDQHYFYERSGLFHGRVYLNALVKPHRCKFWADIDIEFSRDSGTGKKLTAAQVKRMGYDRVADFDPKDDVTTSGEGSEDGCYYCQKCDDWLPQDDPCDHTFTCYDECLDEGVLQMTYEPGCVHMKKALRKRAKKS